MKTGAYSEPWDTQNPRKIQNPVKDQQRPEKHQQIKDLKINLRKEKDTGEIWSKHKVEMKYKINKEEIKLKQKK